MARPKAQAPSRRYHISGQSVCTIDGRDFYLGKHDSPESLARHAALIAIYQAGGLSLPADFDAAELDARAAALLQVATAAPPTHQADEPILVRHLAASYREHVKIRYAESSSEHDRLISICDTLTKHDGDRPAEQYGPLALKRQRQRWIESGASRGYINRLVRAVVRMFKYGVAEELVTESIWQRLKSVEPLRRGETAAPEPEPVKPVSLEAVRKTAENLTPVLRAMLRVQVATGMRPSEVCRMRPCDIDRSGPTWIYRPPVHKTASKGKIRAVPITGDAREALTDYLNRDPSAACFSPAESVAWWQAQKRAARKTKVQPSQRDRSKASPRKQPGTSYDSNAYRQSIQRAAKRAGVEQWHPYQLRHLAATTVREALGIEAVKALLGHSTLAMAEHYAKITEAAAIEAATVAPKL
jgi:integrase